MPRKRKRQAGTSSRGNRSAARNRKRPGASVSRHDTARKRIAAFELLRGRRHGFGWKDAEQQAGITRREAEGIFPRAFYRDERSRLQVRGYDPYTRKLKIPTTKPGEFRWLRPRGSRKASLVGTWLNALRAAGRGDFSLIDAFPRNTFVDGVRLATSHYEVTRIAAASAESDQPFEDIYALAGVA